MELRKVINGSDAGTIGTFARIGWHQPPVRAVPAIGIFNQREYQNQNRPLQGYRIRETCDWKESIFPKGSLE